MAVNDVQLTLTYETIWLGRKKCSALKVPPGFPKESLCTENEARKRTLCQL